MSAAHYIPLTAQPVRGDLDVMYDVIELEQILDQLIYADIDRATIEENASAFSRIVEKANFLLHIIENTRI